jgi:predicted metalloprotease with PDZ domain
VNLTSLKSRPALALLVSAVLAAPALPAADAAPPAPPAPPAAPAPAAPAAAPDSSDLDAQLAAARRKLEQAANEVARLSTQLSDTAMVRVAPLFEPGRALIGVQLESAATGARVREVSPGGPAAEAGIRAGDVIVAVNGTAISGAEPARQVMHLMHEVKPDSRVRVRVLREGKPQEFTLVARGSPVFDFDFSTLPEVQPFMFHRPLMDMELVTLSPRLGSYFGSDKGVLVVRAPADGALKLEDGDVILDIDGRQPRSGSHATRILASYQPGEKITLRILRQHKTQQIEAMLPERSSLQRDMMHHAGPLPQPPRRKLVIFGADAA